uniref:CTCK domain-containing protein n=1 Tax=Oryzias latipes TaxID=8090 RepID=A0A3B3H999_ORYLA
RKSCINVTVYSCDGKCPSATIFNFNINSHARFCKCCRESGLQTRTVSLYCSRNATVVEYNFQEPLDCSCHFDCMVFVHISCRCTQSMLIIRHAPHTAEYHCICQKTKRGLTPC